MMIFFGEVLENVSTVIVKKILSSSLPFREVLEKTQLPLEKLVTAKYLLW